MFTRTKSHLNFFNVFRLLTAANIYSVRRKATPSYCKKADRRRKFSRSNTFEGEKVLTEAKAVEKVG